MELSRWQMEFHFKKDLSVIYSMRPDAAFFGDTTWTIENGITVVIISFDDCSNCIYKELYTMDAHGRAVDHADLSSECDIDQSATDFTLTTYSIPDASSIFLTKTLYRDAETMAASDTSLITLKISPDGRLLGKP